jgi:hypothetical protein
MSLTLVTGPSVSVSGTTASGAATVSVASTAAIAGALTVSGTGIPPGTLVKSVDSATQVTLTADATATGTNTLTFGIEAVDLPSAKKHLKVDPDITEDDDLIAVLITAARRKCEAETWRTFLRSTWDYAIDEFPWGAYWLDGTSSTLSGALYQAVAGTPGVIAPAYGTTWPYGRCRPNGVVIRYVAGYGTTADSVPATVKAAVKLLLSALYVNRGDADVPIPGAVQALLACDQTGAIA